MFTEKQNEVAVGDPSQGEHFHEDGTLPAEPHERRGEAEQMSAVETTKKRRPFSEMPPEERLKAVKELKFAYKSAANCSHTSSGIGVVAAVKF